MSAQLWQHQKEAIDRFAERNSLGLFFEQGTGKTRTAIECYISKCRAHKKILRALIICPVSVVENWRREIVRYAPKVIADQVVVMDGSEVHRCRTAKEGLHRILVTGFSSCIMKKLWAALLKANIEFLIVDESHLIKGGDTKRTKAIIALSDCVHYKMVLTGTPILNSVMDIWAQFRVLDSRIFDPNWYVFRAQYLTDLNSGMPKHLHFPKWVPIKDKMEELAGIIKKHSIRVRKKDALDLPDLVRQEVFVELSTEQKRCYLEMEEAFVTSIGDGVCSADLALTKLLRCQQILCGILKLDDGTIRRIETSKLSALEDLLETICVDHKVIVWSNFIHTYDDIQKVCKKLGLQSKLICGNQNMKERQKNVDEFNTNNDVRVIIANQSAGGVGINLTAASYSIYYSKTFNLGEDLQSEARNHRGGSEIHEKITRIDIIAKGTVDEDINEALKAKANLGELLLQVRRRREEKKNG